MERTKVLAAALALREFTVNELAGLSGVNRHTVRTVLDRDRDIVEKLDSVAPAGPGRPPSKWRVRDSEATRQFTAELQSLPTAPPVASPLTVDNQYEAMVSVAEDALTEVATQRDPALQRQLLESAQSTLYMIDDAPAAEPWWADSDSDVAIRAGAVDALATLVADTPEGQFPDDTLTETARKVAAAMGVVPERGAAVYFAPLTQILASRGELAPMIMVTQQRPPDLGRWDELALSRIEPDARILTQNWALPFLGVAGSMPLVVVLSAVVPLITETSAFLARWLERSRANAMPTLVVRASGRDAFEPPDLPLLSAESAVPYLRVDLESAEGHQVAVQAVSTAVERHAAIVARHGGWGDMSDEPTFLTRCLYDAADSPILYERGC